MCFWNNQTDGHKYYRKIIPAVFNSMGDNKNQNDNENNILIKESLLFISVYLCKF
jgi:hypothetical protein